MSQTGFIGLGRMGGAMASRLIEAGHDVKVWNRTARATEPLAALGATVVDSPAEALATGLTFSMLSNDDAADEVFSDQLLATSAGTTHINMATVSPRSARMLHERHARHGVTYIAAPVLGRAAVAASGQLNIIAAGDSTVIDRAEDLLLVMGKRVWRIGEDPEQANLVKLCLNYNLIHTMQALAESLNLAERNGIDGQTVVDILTDTAYTGTAYVGYGAAIAAKTYDPPAFSVELGLKDLTLVQQAASDTGAALPTAPILEQIFREALDDPALSRLDWSAMAEITRRAEV